MLICKRLLIIVLLSILFIYGCEKEDGELKIETYLYSIETSIEDPGFKCELYGNIWSYIDNDSRVDAHDHFQHTEASCFEMGLSDTYIFAETPVTVKTWNGIKESDKVAIRIKLFEDDEIGDDSFGDEIFQVPVSDIVSGVNQSGDYYEKSGMTVYLGTEWISVTFRFRIVE